MKKIPLVLIFIFLLGQSGKAQVQLTLLDSNTFQLGKGVILSKTSFRGLSVVDDQTIWASGNRGTFARSTDGGKSFVFKQLEAYATRDFRDIEAFDSSNAIMMCSGSPAYILKTSDGGETWREVFKDVRPEIFLDAMDFWDEKHGVVVGDPIYKHFVILETKDAGNSWTLFDTIYTPHAADSEAVFAASGTSLRCLEKNRFAFVSGGKKSVFYQGFIKGTSISWKKQSLPIIQGKNSQGAFSFDIKGKFGIAVGGDYLVDTLTQNNACIAKKYNKEWMAPFESREVFLGYQSCVEIINKNLVIACGTTGVDANTTMNLAYQPKQVISHLSNESFNVVRKAKKGKAVFIAGGKGRIAVLRY
ncbi:MAG: oxidoreductase [Bacteroidota bacterium]|nr:oxidoreductase [Bacteroidota bacterium]